MFAPGSGVFFGVGEGHPHDLLDVVVGEGVVDVFAVASAGDETFGAQDLQPLRDGAHAFAEKGRDLRDATRAMDRKVMEKAETGWVPRGAKERRRARDDVVVQPRNGF